MKRILSVFLACVLLVGCVFALASCGNKPSGAYEGKLEILGQSSTVTYDFGGSKVEITTKTTILGTVNTESEECKYEINETDDGLEITFTYEDDETATFTYEKGDDYIKIGGIQYNKVD